MALAEVAHPSAPFFDPPSAAALQAAAVAHLGMDPESVRLLEELPTAVYVLQHDRFAFFNAAAGDLFGREAAELRRLHWWEVADPAVQPLCRARVRDWLKGRPLEFHGVKPIVTGRGERRWIEVFRRRITFRGAPALLVTGLDLTERQAWLDSTRQAIERFENGSEGGPPDRLTQGIRTASRGPRTPVPELSHSSIRRLTRRQRQVLALVGDARSNKEIGLALGITEGTVKLHVYALMRMLGVANRTMLALAVQKARAGEANGARP